MQRQTQMNDEWEKRINDRAWNTRTDFIGATVITVDDALRIAREAFEAGKRAAFAAAVEKAKTVPVEPADAAPAFVYEWPPEELARASMHLGRRVVVEALESLAKEPGE